MMLTVRLDRYESRLLDELTAVLRVTRSDALRQAIRHLAVAKGVDDGLTALERMKPYIGVFNSGKKDLAANAGRRFREIARKRHARRSR